MANEYYPNVSYENAEGVTVTLSGERTTDVWEMNGRSGAEVPELSPTSITYADGSQRVVSAKLNPRTVTLQMVVRGASQEATDTRFHDLMSRLIQTGSRDEWGKLIFTRSDGKQVYLSALYTGGANVADQYRRLKVFTLEFSAGDPYFYNINETEVTASSGEGGTFLNDGIYLGAWTMKSGAATDLEVYNNGEACFPVLKIHGPAAVIEFTNKATGKTLALDPDYVLLADDELTVNCRPGERKITLTSGGKDTDVTYLLDTGSSLNWKLERGKNSIAIAYTGGASGTDYRLYFRERYLSA